MTDTPTPPPAADNDNKEDVSHARWRFIGDVLVLQLKLGTVQPRYFMDKYDVDILRRFSDQFASLLAEGHLSQADERAVSLSRQGLLRVDALLPRFFLPRHTGIRYT